MTIKLVQQLHPADPPSDTVVRRRRHDEKDTLKHDDDDDDEDDDDGRNGAGRMASSSDDDSSSSSFSSEGSVTARLLPSSPPREEEEEAAAVVPTSSDARPSSITGPVKSGGGDGAEGGGGAGTRLLRFLTCAVGINVCYLCYGVVHERTFVVVREAADAAAAGGDGGVGGGEGGRPITAFILVTQAATNALAAWAWMLVRGRWRRRGGGGNDGRVVVKESDREGAADGGERVKEAPPLNHGLLLLTALSYAAAMTCTNESMRYVSYPTAALCKSCKLVPTMIAGILVQKKNYPLRDWMGVVCITAGIVVFNLSRVSKGGGREEEDSAVGLFLLFLSLVMDGTLGWCQGLLKTNDDDHRHRYRPPGPLETMMYTNLHAIAFFGPYAAVTGQLRNGLDLLLLSPYTNTAAVAAVAVPATSWGIGSMISLLNLSAALGQFFIFTTIEWFSPVVCTTLTTTRKFFTILLSIWKYDHILSGIQWVGVALVFGGLYVQIVCRVLGGGGGGDGVGDGGKDEEGIVVVDRSGDAAGEMETKKVK